MAAEWLYYKLYPGDPQHLNRFARRLLPDVVRLAFSAARIQKWFFLNYTDDRGVHLRLRFSAPRRQLDAAFAAVDPVLKRAVRNLSEPGRPSGCFQDIYEPETEKFDGPAGQQIAETVFQSSSEATLRLLRGPASDHRSAVGLIVMQQTAEAMLADSDHGAFWAKYQDHWTADPGNSPHRREHISSAARRDAPRAAAQVRGMLENESVMAPVASYIADLRLARAHLVAHGLSPDAAAFHYLHLANNRLGIPPYAEAYLAHLITLI